MPTVVQANKSDKENWNRFAFETSLSKTSQAKTSQGAHHAHSWEWSEIIYETFGHKPYYFITKDSEQKISGILPLFHVKSILFGSALISVPYLNSGGILASNKEAFNALMKKAEELSKELKVKYTELRHQEAHQWYPEDTTTLRTHKISMVLPLDCSAEDLFSSFKPKLRSQIRRPSKSGITSEVITGEDDFKKALDGFYSVFSNHMRDLGTPVFPRALFDKTCRTFGTNAKIITAWHLKECVAAGITIEKNKRIEIPWASSLRRFNKASPNMLLYWEAIKTAADSGALSFDFGRSSQDSGQHRFKKQWGSQPVPLHWYYLGDKDSIPDIAPNNPKFSTLVKCWRKLPLPVSKIIGPWITRSLP